MIIRNIINDLVRLGYLSWLPNEYHFPFAVSILLLGSFVAIFLLSRAIKPQNRTNNTKENDTKTTTPVSTEQQSWPQRLFAGLSKTRSSLNASISSLFTGNKIDAELLESLHEVLYRADIGTKTADLLTEEVKNNYSNRENPPEWHEVKNFLIEKISSILTNKTSIIEPEEGPQVILVVGVNGVGKTTSIGKLASYFLEQNHSTLLAAADTYRAAAIDQLKVWGDRLGVDVIHHRTGGDPAAVAYDSVKAACSRKIDRLLIDTAGRLHNKKELMLELQKIKRVIGKDLAHAPHETWIVIDSTTGQNAFQQIRAFQEVVELTGLIVTKLDGTAKGGVIIGAAEEFGLPIRFIGIGEKVDDLREFSANDFATSLFE